MTDVEGHAERRSGFMIWLRSRFRLLGGVAGAMSYADLGPYAGAPRNPALRVGDEQTYSTVRYATEHVAYVATSTTADVCGSCLQPMAEVHEIQRRRGDEVRLRTGAARACRACEPDSWLFRSRSAAAARARDADRRNVV